MSGIQKSFRIPPDTLKEMEQIAKETGRDLSAIAKDLLVEAIKMRRCPGILFAEGTSGRRAKIVGTGVEVWEIVSAYRGMDENFERLKKAYHWLSPDQLRAALGYYTIYPEEINRLIELNENWTEEKLRERFPFMSAPS